MPFVSWKPKLKQSLFGVNTNDISNLNCVVIKIQRWYRKLRSSRFRFVNDTDMITFEKIKGIPFRHVADAKHVYRFQPETLVEYMIKENKFENYITRQPFHVPELRRLDRNCRLNMGPNQKFESVVERYKTHNNKKSVRMMQLEEQMSQEFIEQQQNRQRGPQMGLFETFRFPNLVGHGPLGIFQEAIIVPMRPSNELQPSSRQILESLVQILQTPVQNIVYSDGGGGDDENEFDLEAEFSINFL